MLKVTTDRTPYHAVKPNAQIVKMCMEQVGAKPEEVLVVGDRLYTDIACGINAGVETALVYTGEAKPEDLVATEFMPDYAFENIRKLYEAFRKSREAVTEQEPETDKATTRKAVTEPVVSKVMEPAPAETQVQEPVRQEARAINHMAETVQEPISHRV